MKNDTQDNEPLSFLRLAAVTANVVRFLELAEQKHEESKRNADTNSAREQNPERERDNIDDNLFPFRAVI